MKASEYLTNFRFRIKFFLFQNKWLNIFSQILFFTLEYILYICVSVCNEISYSRYYNTIAIQ